MTTQIKMSISENITMELAQRRTKKRNKQRQTRMLSKINYILIIVSEQIHSAAHYNGTLSLFSDLNLIQKNQSPPI